MKSIILILIIFLSIVSCTKKQKETKTTLQDTIKVISLPFSSELLKYDKKDKNGYFIYDESFKEDKMFNASSRIYGKYILNSKVQMFIVERKPKDDEHNEPIVVLYSIDDNRKRDSLIIYENVEWEGSFKKRFEIKSNNEIEIFEELVGSDFNDDGSEIFVEDKKYEIYSINQQGKFIKKTIKKLTNSSLNESEWKGRYHFEAFNKDHIKHSYDIVINTLENISLTSIDGEDKEVYSDLIAEKVAENKIKLVYNSSYEDDMGIIYIEQQGKNYYLSGNPIYFINPGTNEGLLVKLE
jgi:hypothetical protein